MWVVIRSHGMNCCISALLALPSLFSLLVGVNSSTPPGFSCWALWVASGESNEWSWARPGWWISMTPTPLGIWQPYPKPPGEVEAAGSEGVRWQGPGLWLQPQEWRESCLGHSRWKPGRQLRLMGWAGSTRLGVHVIFRVLYRHRCVTGWEDVRRC